MTSESASGKSGQKKGFYQDSKPGEETKSSAVRTLLYYSLLMFTG